MSAQDTNDITTIVRAARAGDVTAFARLVQLYQDMAVAYARSYLGDHHLAEDAAQEAFAAAWHALSDLREPAAFTAWFRRILFKYCDRILRRRQHQITDLHTAGEQASNEPTALENLESDEIKEMVRLAIARLPDNERSVVLLYYMGDHSARHTAVFLGITVNAVKTRLYAARKRLKKYMATIEENLDASRPSKDPKFAEKIQRMIRPAALKKDEPLFWSPGIGNDVWDMFCAAITGDLDTIRRLLDKDPSLLRCQHEYRNPMSFAVRENQLEVAAFFLQQGVNAQYGGGDDPLPEIARYRGYQEMQRLLEDTLAAKHNTSPKGEIIAGAIKDRNLENVKALLDADPDLLHASDIHGNRPIHWAAMTREIGIIDELLARGADIDAQRADGARPIQLYNGDYSYRGWRDVPKTHPVKPRDVLFYLRDRGAYVEICTAAYIGDLPRVQQLVEQDPSVANKPGDYVNYYPCSGTPLRNAATGGHLDIVRYLLDNGSDPNLPEEGFAPRGHALYSAVYYDHYDIAKLLLEHGAEPNAPVESSADPLSIAMNNNNPKMVDLLCSYGAARSMDILAYYGDTKTAAAIFAINPSLANDPVALAHAAEEGNESFVRLLLHYVPDLAKQIGVAAKTPELTRFLFSKGMDPNKQDWLRVTPLHRFAKKGDVANAGIFLEHGADLNARDEDISSTPLAWAAKYGKIQMVEFLLQRGARPHLPDDPSWATPLAWATFKGHTDIAGLLQQEFPNGNSF